MTARVLSENARRAMGKWQGGSVPAVVPAASSNAYPAELEAAGHPLEAPG